MSKKFLIIDRYVLEEMVAEGCFCGRLEKGEKCNVCTLFEMILEDNDAK